jgi:hypothetical protein
VIATCFATATFFFARERGRIVPLSIVPWGSRQQHYLVLQN